VSDRGAGTGTGRGPRRAAEADPGPAAPPLPPGARSPEHMDPAGRHLDHEQDVQRRKNTVSTVRKSTASTPGPGPEKPPLRLDGHASVGRSTAGGRSPKSHRSSIAAGRTPRARPGGQQPRQPSQHRTVRPSPPQASPPAVAAPRPHGAAAARRSSPPNCVSAAQAAAAPGRTVDRAVAGSCGDHRGRWHLRRTCSSAPTTDFPAPTGGRDIGLGGRWQIGGGRLLRRRGHACGADSDGSAMVSHCRLNRITSLSVTWASAAA
jgi:hypothetical protein